jgi:hypothetical protein
MSVSAHWKATVIAPGGPRQVLRALLDAGWTHGEAPGWRCVPLGDDDEWDWRLLEGDGAEIVLGLLDKKMEAREVFGVELSWAGTNVGITVLLPPQANSAKASALSLLVGADINRMKKGVRVTDSEWYTSRLLPAFDRPGGPRLERWDWVESD